MLDFLKTVLTIQLFWALAVTLLVSTIPSQHLQPVSLFVYSSSADSLETIGTDLENNVQGQLNIPLVDAAALVFYSGNLLVDLFLNFLTAIPQIFTLILDGFFLLFPTINGDVQTYLKLFAFSILTVMYFLGIINFISKSRALGGLN